MIVICPHCKKESSLYFRTKDHNRRITSETFAYYRCPSCNLIFLSPLPDELGKYYPVEYYSVPLSREQLETAAEHDRFKINIVQQFVAGGRLLEIGPSHGKFAFLAKQAGFEVEALERDSDCCTFLRDTIGIKVINSDDPTEGLRNVEKYNVITLWHVIEHLPDPWKTLATISEKLVPGGILIIAAPNPDAFQFHVLGRYWTHLDAPRHLSLIPLSLLQKQAQSDGLIPVWSTTKDKGSLLCNISGWKDSIANMARSGFFRKRLRTLGGFLSLLASPIERINGRGGAYTVVFRKGL